MADKVENWLAYTHPEYAAKSPSWVFAQDYYSGQVLEPAKVKTYLIKRKQGEADSAFEERTALADYTNHMATVVDSLAGMLFGVESDASRTYTTPEGKGILGSEEDPESVISHLKKDADGKGAGLATLLKLLCSDLIVTFKVWVAVDTDANGNPLVRIIPPTSVPNWRPDAASGNLAEVVVKEEVDVRLSIREKTTPKAQYVVYGLTGWERWTVSDKGEPQLVGGPGGSGSYKYVDRRGFPALPIFPVELPIRRMVGYVLAKKAHVIFNKESERDWLLRVANMPKLNLMATDAEFKAIGDKLKEGNNALQNNPNYANPHGYIAPDAGPATISTKVLENKRDEFYVTGFREYGDAAAERTATEVRQDVGAGVAAFLQLLKSAMDDAENGIYWRLEQLLNPGSTGLHFIAHVERSDDFVPVDVNMTIQRTRARFFGETAVIPLGRSAQIQAAKRIADWEGINVPDEEVEAAVDAFNAERTLALGQVLPLPAEALVRMTMRYLASVGIVDASEVTMADGTMVSTQALMESQARELADASSLTRVRQAETFPGQPGGSGSLNGNLDPNAPPTPPDPNGGA